MELYLRTGDHKIDRSFITTSTRIKLASKLKMFPMSILIQISQKFKKQFVIVLNKSVFCAYY